MTSERIAELCQTAEKRDALMTEICDNRCARQRYSENCEPCPVKELLKGLILAERTAAVSTTMLITAEEMLGKRAGGTSPAPAESTDGGKAQELPWKKLHVGQVVWFLWWDDDANAWEIGQEVATAVGYEGFWYSGDLKNPLSADALVPWDRIGVDAFLTQQAARERMEAANGN